MTAVIAMEEFLQTDEAKDVMRQAAREQGYKLLRDVLQTSGVTVQQSQTQTLPAPAQPAAPTPAPTTPTLGPTATPIPFDDRLWVPYEPTLTNGNGHGPNL